MQNSFINLPEALIPRLQQALAATDTVAYHNVTHDNDGASILDETGKPVKGKFSRGGPFGAMLGISLEDGSFEQIGTPRGNNVVGSGIASRHAEDQALLPDNYAALTARLTELQTQGRNPYVWMISSGQSCPNCHTKQEIVARNLESQGLIGHGRFMTLYGATFDETFKIAQFYDAQYADAMVFNSLMPDDPHNLIRQEYVDYSHIQGEVREILAGAERPTAVVVRHGEVYAIGRESRVANDLFATAEVNAVRAACVQNRKSGEFASWAVDGELYTTSREIGPLLFAEAGWTKIGLVKSVAMPDELAHRQFETRETSALGNRDFLQIVAGGYHDPEASVQVLRSLAFKNTAQPKWAEMLRVNGEQLYNGAAVSPEVEGMRNGYTRFRFAAADLCGCGDHGHRPIQYLETLNPGRSCG